MLFRGLNDKVRVLPEDQVDFSMGTGQSTEQPQWLSRAFSRTLVLFVAASLRRLPLLRLYYSSEAGFSTAL